jgi:hypothetical protein
VRRAIALFVVLALLPSLGFASLQHVHAYDDHHHDEHSHSVGAHAHGDVVLHHRADERAARERLTPCDPGSHVVPTAFVGIASRPVSPPVAIVVVPYRLTRASSEWRATRPDDLRVHGPPRLTDAPLRAPPVPHAA